jgi:signal recognition particle GTPase
VIYKELCFKQTLTFNLFWHIQTNRERALKEKVPPGISRREHVIKVVYEELTRFVGDKPVPIKMEPGKKKNIMLVGIQGSGKTTHAAKLARYFQKGLETRADLR